jgi:hypothetical protein
MHWFDFVQNFRFFTAFVFVRFSCMSTHRKLDYLKSRAEHARAKAEKAVDPLRKCAFTQLAENFDRIHAVIEDNEKSALKLRRIRLSQGRR